MKTLLLNLFGSFPVGAIWSKVKFGLLVLAMSFMLWQGLQMSSLQKDVSHLETVQTSLQEQVTQVKANYDFLQTNYQQSAQTSQEYFEALDVLKLQSTGLEKSFATLEKRSRQMGTTPEAEYEKPPTGAHSEPERQGSGTGADGGDAEWRKLLDDTYCRVHPTVPKCIK